MGYTTRFVGTLHFDPPLSGAVERAFLNSILNDDQAIHPWKVKDLAYIDLEIKRGGLEWNGAEKTYEMEKQVNAVVEHMRKEFPRFGLIGELQAQGEDITDRWRLVIGEDGVASRVEVAVTGKKVTCPHCEEEFILE